MPTEPPTAAVEYFGNRLEVRELASGWRASYGEHTVEDRYLDLALGRILGRPPGATLPLIWLLFPGDSA